jgi:cytochrome oxidase Cu insertion factor (SCO1/SenC/PrrC family)
MRTLCRLTGFLTLGLILAGCGPYSPSRAPAGLNVGDLAPEIEGEDLDGRPFKLSDYRGKVVVLDFWGHW